VETRADLAEKKPKVVQCFVDASALGWVNYLHGDNKAANALIKKSNAEMTDDLIDFSIRKMKEYGIVESGDALTKGIGAISDANVKDFHEKMVKAGLFKAGEIDISKSYTTKFVNTGVGLDLKKKLTGK
jgi:NitT/TauT family transport system substrate-binding protein